MNYAVVVRVAVRTWLAALRQGDQVSTVQRADLSLAKLGGKAMAIDRVGRHRARLLTRTGTRDGGRVA